MVYRIQIYIILINIPFIVLIHSGIFYNNSLLPLEVSFKLDEIFILIISGYICYKEESRQTPVRGFVFVKDSTVLLVMLFMLINLYKNGILNI